MDLVETQHLLGGVVFEKVADDLASGDWQIQASHRRAMQNGQEGWWTGHSYVKHYYQKIGQDWLFAGVEPHTVVLHNGLRQHVIGHFE